MRRLPGWNNNMWVIRKLSPGQWVALPPHRLVKDGLASAWYFRSGAEMLTTLGQSKWLPTGEFFIAGKAFKPKYITGAS